jgi:hypothetical protein
MVGATENSAFDGLEMVVAEAHGICEQILLFEAIDMEEEEVRLFLYCNHVSDQELQDTYLGFVRDYDRMTSGRKIPWGRGM